MKVIITGASGMVGEGVLLECLADTRIEKILLVTRRTTGYQHSKIEEVVHENFFDLSTIQSSLKGYDACFFCLGVSSIGLNEDQYRHLTYDLTLNFAKTILALNNNVVFCYVSGSGTSSSEKGSMWARVKGKTENDLLALGFVKAYMFRPGFLQPTPGSKNALKFYKYVSWMFPFLLKAFPSFVGSLKDLGRAMIYVSLHKQDQPLVLEVKDIRNASRLLR